MGGIPGRNSGDSVFNCFIYCPRNTYPSRCFPAPLVANDKKVHETLYEN